MAYPLNVQQPIVWPLWGHENKWRTQHWHTIIPPYKVDMANLPTYIFNAKYQILLIVNQKKETTGLENPMSVTKSDHFRVTNSHLNHCYYKSLIIATLSDFSLQHRWQLRQGSCTPESLTDRSVESKTLAHYRSLLLPLLTIFQSSDLHQVKSMILEHTCNAKTARHWTPKGKETSNLDRSIKWRGERRARCTIIPQTRCWCCTRNPKWSSQLQNHHWASIHRLVF